MVEPAGRVGAAEWGGVAQRLLAERKKIAEAVSRALGDFHFKPVGMDPARCKAP